mmetsp:Transcript_27359/g.75253  ORF Transcript_27359/g.75253 Transcript_27359/m.75253 type:complete len:275 (+) Transcript_27359:818-1642(+)
MRAGHILNATTAHPGAEADLHLLAPVEPHLRVVPAQPKELPAVSREEPTGHDRRGLRLRLGLCAHGHLPQRPREAYDAEARAREELEVLVVDAVYAGRHHCPGVLTYAVQQWLHPARRALDVGVQEDEHVPARTPSTLHAREHQPPPLLQPDQAHLGQDAEVLRELLLQPLPVTLVEAALVRHAGVVAHYDLREQPRGRVVEHAVHGAHEGREGLIVEDDHDAGIGQRVVLVELFVLLLAHLAAHVLLGPIQRQGVADAVVEGEAAVSVPPLLA